MKKPTRIRVRNEAKILAAAQTTFAAYGFHGATVEQVSQLADMSQPNLHNYFKTKTDLYAAVLEQTLTTWLDLIDDLDADQDPASELRRYVSQKVEMARASPAASRVFASEILQGAPVLGPKLKGRVRQKVEHFVAVIDAWAARGLIRPINAYHLIFMIWGSTQHYADFLPQVKAVMGRSRLTKADYESAEQSICDILLNGLMIPR